MLGLLKPFFRPGFLNRVDETAVFHAFDRARDRPDRRHSLRSPETAAYRRIELEVTEAAKRFFAEAGYDPVYGARPIKRSVQRGLETEIARRLVLGEIEEGRKLTVDLSDGELRFLTARPEMVVAS